MRPESMLVPMHGVGSRSDLPLPFALVVIGSALVVAVTFWLIARSWGQARWLEPGGVPLPRLTRVVDSPLLIWPLRALVVAVCAVAWLALVAGPDRVSNPFPGFLFVWVWVGLVPLSILAGGVWARLHPIRTLLWWLPRVRTTTPMVRLGLWPAAVALLGFGFLELVQPDRATTAVLRWWALAWLVWVIAGALARGGSWIASADPFEAYATAVARLSPWQRIDGVLCWVNPLRQLTSQRTPAGLWVVTAGLLGVTAFDSLGSSLTWVRWVQSVTSDPAMATLLSSLGYAVTVAIAVGLYRLACGWMDRWTSTAGSWRLLGPALLPIVVGYAVAHYTTLFILEGQRVAITLSDPLGSGQNWFGTAEGGVNAAIFDHPGLVAWIQVAGIVVGHVVGVVCGHDLAVRRLPPEHQLRAQLPVLAVMVLFTCLGLLLLFAR